MDRDKERPASSAHFTPVLVGAALALVGYPLPHLSDDGLGSAPAGYVMRE
jgi:hypothetical protein